jgi:hypothetical protein
VDLYQWTIVLGLVAFSFFFSFVTVVEAHCSEWILQGKPPLAKLQPKYATTMEIGPSLNGTSQESLSVRKQPVHTSSVSQYRL